jgi:regulator of PEP synthase PpsR (kinase-PPPase family)
MPDSSQAPRTVFFVSDGTGITAETFGNSILAQFQLHPRHVRLPFVDSPEKAAQAVARINDVHRTDGIRPIVFITLVNDEAVRSFDRCTGLVLDMFGTFVRPLEQELNQRSTHTVGRFGDIAQDQTYQRRIEAINFSLLHDDGQSSRNLAQADVILVGVSRSGKTPTSLYLAMQHGIKAANYPLTPDDFERRSLPQALLEHRGKLFGLSIDPERLAQIRNERRAGSNYASLANCHYEVAEAERMMRREGIRWLSTTHKSIEEISTTILQVLRPEGLIY